MSKYHPITDFLSDQPPDRTEITLTFSRLEEILGFLLPASAHNHRPWWGNERNKDRSQARAWMAAGWKVETANLGKQWVRFVKQ